MGTLNEHMKKDFANALNDKNETVFVVDHFAEEIEAYPGLKELLQRYLDHPDMECYTARELKALRYKQRKYYEQ